MACLDTTVFIDLHGRGGERQKQVAVNKLSEIIDRQEVIVTTRFNLAELYVGLALSRIPQIESKAIDVLLADFGILDFDDPAAYLYGQIRAYQKQLGQPSGDMDLLIAATALANGHGLITRNVAHFQNIPGLRVEGY